MVSPELLAERVAYTQSLGEIQAELVRLHPFVPGDPEPPRRTPAQRAWAAFWGAFPDASVSEQLQTHLDALAAVLPPEYQVQLHGLAHLVSVATARAARISELSRKRRRRRRSK